jgi:hypothetical protein
MLGDFNTAFTPSNCKAGPVALLTLKWGNFENSGGHFDPKCPTSNFA